ncbi:MAG: DUF1554 domain-containing protein [Deltaproteobacteria bacterium]|nr:DUF1554 domain-containing protein [Nannocystaceae bacterium]
MRSSPWRGAMVLVLIGGCYSPKNPSNDSLGDTSSASSSGDAPTSMTSSMSTQSGTGPEPSTTDSTTASTTTSTDATDATTTTDPDSSTSSADATTGPGVCGDGQQDDGEACDDGVNAGQHEGDCAPDCSVVVQQKLIRLSQNSVAGDFAPGMNPVEVGDSFCPDGYLAFFADGINRVASVAPRMGNGQVDWVLQPWTEYVNPDGDRMWTTTELLLLGVADDNTWVGLENALTPTTDSGYSGMWGDYTTSSLTCSNWSSTAGANKSFGQVHQTTELFVGPPSGGTGGLCSVAGEFTCVEQ